MHYSEVQEVAIIRVHTHTQNPQMNQKTKATHAFFGKEKMPLETGKTCKPDNLHSMRITQVPVFVLLLLSPLL